MAGSSGLHSTLTVVVTVVAVEELALRATITVKTYSFPPTKAPASILSADFEDVSVKPEVLSARVLAAPAESSLVHATVHVYVRALSEEQDAAWGRRKKRLGGK